MAARAEDLLPVEYFYVVFTLPAEVAQIAYWNKKADMTCCSALWPRR